jgi:hypothetical protein
MQIMLVAFVFAGGAAHAQYPEKAFRQLPKSTVAALAAPSGNQAFENVLRMGPMEVLTGPAFKPFQTSISGTELKFKFAMLAQLPWDPMFQLLDTGGFAAAIFEDDKQLPHSCLIFEMNSHDEDWKTLIEQHVTELAKSGLEVTDGCADDLFLWTAKNTQGSGELHCFIHDDWCYLADSATCLNAIKNRDPTDSNTLEADLRFSNTIGELKTIDDKAGDVWFFIEPLRTDYLRARSEGWQETDIAKTFGATHGFDAVRAVGGWASFGETEYDIRYRAKVWISEPQDRGMQLLQWRASEQTQPGDWVQKPSLSSYVTLNWDLSSILPNLGPIANEIIRETTGRSDNTFEAILERIGSDDGPGIDLQKEFIPLLGPRIEYISTFTFPASETSEQTIVAIEVNNEEDVADQLSLLVEGAREISVPGFDFPLWKLGSGQRPGGAGPSFSTPGAMVASGRLFFASNYDAIRNYVATRSNRQPMSADPQFLELQGVLDKVAGPSPAVRIISLPALDFQNTYELLRTGRVDKSESFYAMLLAPLLRGVKDTSMFARLPPFSAIESKLGPACIQVNIASDGWEVHGINVRAE